MVGLTLKRSSSSVGPTGTQIIKRARTTYSGVPAYKASFTTTKPRTKVELKRRSDLMQNGTVGITGIVQPFPVVSSGDNPSNRDGRAIEVRGYQYSLNYIPTSVTPYEKFRVIIFLWKMNPTPPVAGDILDVSHGAGTYLSPYNINNSNAYDIISDVVYDCNPKTIEAPPSTNEYASNVLSLNKRGTKKFVTTYNTPIGDIQSIVDNHMFMLCVPLMGGGNCVAVGSITYVDV